LLEGGKQSNRLSSTTVGMQNGQPVAEPYTYDSHGSMTRMSHLPVMERDYRDQVHATSKQVVTNGGTPEITYYVYDAAGQRARKVTERQAAVGQTPARKEERIYLGGFEIYREYENDGNTVKLERDTLHIVDDTQRIALVETRTIDSVGDDPAPDRLTRYQFGNHLGSASLELDDAARIISYEEYTPYGNTSYQAVRNQTDTPKRYRYTGMERDEETGFSYHGARHYVPWLGTWTSADPTGLADGVNLYAYVGSDPIGFVDRTGTERQAPDIAQMERRVTALNAQIATAKAKLAQYDADEAAARVSLVATLLHARTELSTMKTQLATIRANLEISQQTVAAMRQEQRKRDEWNESHGFFDKLITSYDKEMAYREEKEKHRDREVKRNFLLDGTDAVIKATPGAAANTFTVFSGSLGTAKVPTRIGASGGLDDCAACTAARAIRESTGIEVEAAELVRKYGLPSKTIISFTTALNYAKNYLTRIGIRLAEKPRGFAPIAEGGTEGMYAIFLEGGKSGGHVVFGRVTKSGLEVIDDQLGGAGRTWSSIESAERALGMKAKAAYRIESVTPPP
jgi:RHS repeat-associated protein